MADYKVVDADQLDADLKVVADAIRRKGGTTEDLEFPYEMESAVDAIQSGGGTNWLDYTLSVTRMFQSATVPDNSEIDISFGSKAIDVFETNVFIDYFYYRAKGARKIKLSCGFKCEKQTWATSFENMASNQGDLLHTIDVSGISHIPPTSLLRFVYSRNNLVEILGVLDLSFCTVTSNAFTNCNSLETVRFAPSTIKLSINFNDSSKLSAESIQSIIDGLATVETTQTLTFHADVKAKLTDEQIATITSKNWTLA